MVYHTQNYWALGLFPSSGILGTRKHDVSETGSVSVLRFRGKTPTQLGPLDRELTSITGLILARYLLGLQSDTEDEGSALL
jgi:hypothetical protein